MKMESASLILLAGAIIMVVGEILHIVGLATRYWITTSTNIGHDINIGLWKFCGNNDCYDVDDDIVSALWEKVEDDVKAVRAMVILGMLCGLVGIGTAVLMVVFSFLRKTVPSFTPIVSLGATIAAFVFIIIGIIVFGAETYPTIEDYYGTSVTSEIGYSFGLCIVGAILLLVGGGTVLTSKGGSAPTSAIA